jgi:hypothetical protein
MSRVRVKYQKVDKVSVNDLHLPNFYTAGVCVFTPFYPIQIHTCWLLGNTCIWLEILLTTMVSYGARIQGHSVFYPHIIYLALRGAESGSPWAIYVHKGYKKMI